MNDLRAALELFSPIPDHDWKVFSALFSERKMKKHDSFAQAGRTEREIGFIRSGIFRAFYRNKGGTEFNKAFFEEGELIGAFTSLVTGEKNQIHFEALSDAKLLCATYADIVALFDKHPAIERLSRKHAEYLFTIKDKREVDLVLLDARERYEVFKREYPGLENKVTQYHIASYLGITPTQLSRIRSAG